MCAIATEKKFDHTRSGNPSLAISPLTMIPVGPNGDSDAALEPLASMIAMRNAEIPVCPATAIAVGATSATEAMLPGPTNARNIVRKKNITGMSPMLPRQTITARWAILARYRWPRRR